VACGGLSGRQRTSGVKIIVSMKRFLLWDYPRAVWQYDVMVGLILAFIFLTPRDFFRDQPRASSIIMLPAEREANVYWLEPKLLVDTPESDRLQRTSELLRQRYGRTFSVIRLEPTFDSEKEIIGFHAYTRP
jgi:hypothetical protein